MKATRSSKPSPIICHHEAGHAVIACALGAGLRRVSVRADGGGVTSVSSLSARNLDRLLAADLHDDDWRTRAQAERYLLMILAGPYAQKRFAPRSDWRQRRVEASDSYVVDFDKVSGVLQGLHDQDAKTANLHLRYLEAKTERLIEDYWTEIGKIAHRLGECGALTGKQVRAEAPFVPASAWHQSH